MKTYEVLEQKHSSEWRIMTTQQVSELTATDIYEKYFAVKPFVGEKTRNLLVNDTMRMYLHTGSEYEEYKTAVAAKLLSLLTVDPETLKGGSDAR